MTALLQEGGCGCGGLVGVADGEEGEERKSGRRGWARCLRLGAAALGAPCWEDDSPPRPLPAMGESAYREARLGFEGSWVEAALAV